MHYLSPLPALVLLLIAFGSSTKQICYVRPNNDSSVTCPGYNESCLTLDQYAQQTTHQCFSTGSTLLFLPGNHTLYSKVQLENVSDILFSGEGGNDSVRVILNETKLSIHYVNVTNLQIEGITFCVLHSRIQDLVSPLLNIINSTDILLHNLTMQGGKAVICNNSNVRIISCLFKANTAYTGGAVSVTDNSNVTIDGNVFINNTATFFGGAVYVTESSLVLLDSLGNTFAHNSANIGGAIFVGKSLIYIVNNDFTTTGSNIFQHNKARYIGGAISLLLSQALLNGTITNFQNNHAYSDSGAGGAIFMRETFLLLGGKIVTFANNSATNLGGGIFILTFKLIITAEELNFVNNTATNEPGLLDGLGGGIYAQNSEIQVIGRVTVSNFINNKAIEGGALFLYSCNITYRNLNCIGNSGSAMKMNESNARFDNIRVANNTGINSGGMILSHSSVFFSGSTVFEGNTATGKDYSSGGAISAERYTNISFIGVIAFTNNRATRFGGAIVGALRVKIALYGYCLFLNNTAEYGGAIYATQTNLILSDSVNFTSNRGRLGGAMTFDNGATLTLKKNVTITSSNNHASNNGGFMMHRDMVDITTYQCYYKKDERTFDIFVLPVCFIQFEGLNLNNSEYLYSIHSTNDSADFEGSFIFGGLMDKCRVLSHARVCVEKCIWSNQWNLLWPIMMDPESHVLDIQSRSNAATKPISSEAFVLCFCRSRQEYNCSKEINMTVYRGQKFGVPLLALSQGDYIAWALVSSILSPTARLELNQSEQTLPDIEECTELKYNLYSTKEEEKLLLFTNSTCRDNGLGSAVVNVKFRGCPRAFILSGDQCVCEKRLQAYQAKCKIYNGEDEIFILRSAGQDFWVSVLYLNLSYQGLILSDTCPVQYCKTKAVNITLDHPDIQCGLNRSGVLCGGCADNYSLLLGSSRCEVCSHSYVSLLLVFAAAGVVLVVFLSFLRLTVASGMINTVILYANIVQANRRLFFPNSTNILTVFIAWMNLDLGFETCFYQGMNAYVQTWLQFAFPVYVWILISLIIVASRHSIVLTKLIGSNPIAVLATLLLMSYTKILKIAIEVYTFGRLDYPDNKTVTVWLKDANVPFLQTWHLFLTVVTSLVLVFLFLPYTLFLLLGHKLYRFSGRRHLRWLNRLKPLLDSYYAPYEKHTRYWTGFLLLIRCVLYIVFSLDSLVVSTRSIIITFTAITVIAWLSVRIYKKFHANAIEASVYLNLIILAVFTTNSPAVWLVYPLVSVVFVTMIGIVLHHIHSVYIAKSTVWLNVKAKANFIKLRLFRAPPTPETTLMLTPTKTSSHDPHKIVSKTVIHFREQLLESYTADS